MTDVKPRSALFHPGQVVMTPGAMREMKRAGDLPSQFLGRHVIGDWGTLKEHDRQMNEAAVKTGDRLLSSYETGKSVVLWIITDAVDGDPKHRATTTILLPDDY